MLQFIEFSDFSRQTNSLFSQADLSPIENFFKCLELAEDSYLDSSSKKVSALQHELQTAIKQEGNSNLDGNNIGVYKKSFMSALELKLKETKLKEHQQRKNIIRELAKPKSPYLRDRITQSDGQPDLQKKMKILSHLSRDPSLHFESYSTLSLVKLNTVMTEIRTLQEYIQRLKRKVSQKSKRSNLSIYATSILYLEALEKLLSQAKEAWCENLLDRLEKASSSQDIYYSDNLFKLIESINHHFNREDENIPYPKNPRRDLSEVRFLEAQVIIRSFGTDKQKSRLKLLSWNQASEEFKELRSAKNGIQIAPTIIFNYLVHRTNWILYLLFPSYRYRHNFLKKHAYLFAQLKLLSEKKKSSFSGSHSITENPDLIQLKNIEQKIKTIVSSLKDELVSENSKIFKSKSKLLLISNSQKFFNQALGLIIQKKIEVLREHAEKLRIYVATPELSEVDESGNFLLYHTPTIKKALLSLRQEIVDGINELDQEAAYSINLKFKFTDFILRSFYKIDEPISEPSPPSYEASELEILAQSSLACLFLMSKEQLNAKLEHYQIGYQKLCGNSDPITLRAVEQSLYQLIINYLEFIDQHLDELTAYNEKLNIIEDQLIKANPIATGYLREIQRLRMKPETNRLTIKLQCRIIMKAVKPEIRKRSLSRVVRSVFENSSSQENQSDLQFSL